MSSILNYAAISKKIFEVGKQTYCCAVATFSSRRFSRITKLNSSGLSSFLNDDWTYYNLRCQRFRSIKCSSCGGLHIRPIHITPSCTKKRKTKEEKVLDVSKRVTRLQSANHFITGKTKNPITVHLKPRIRSEVVDVWVNMTVEDLANSLGKDVDHVFEAMMFVDNSIDYDTPDASIDRIQVIKDVVKKSGCRCIFIPNPAELKPQKIIKDVEKRPPSDEKSLVRRPPVVTIMGHVDHGKTTLLDSLRHTSVVEQEFGGITQHIGAFTVKLPMGSIVTFLDTPGHAAFTAMRARGAKVTDIIVLVVAADDGVMPQTLESIQHAANANVPIIVAINKVDKFNSDIERTKKGLLNHGIVLEEFGGDVQAVPISALKGTNLDLLVDAIVTQAEVLDLKADPGGLMEGYVIESRTDYNKGRLATVIVERGTLKKGANLVAGTAWAKVRAMYDDKGQAVQKALPSMPVEVAGWRDLPSAGDEVLEVPSESRAKEIQHYRMSLIKLEKQKDEYEVIKTKQEEHNVKYKAELAQRRLEGKFRKRSTGERPKESIEITTGPRLPIVLKGDVDGSVEAILNVIATYHSSKLSLDILQYAVGSVTESDVEMAHLFQGVVYAFNVPTLDDAKQAAASSNVPIKTFNIIYRLIENLKEEINSRLPLLEEDEIIGQANVAQEFLINEGKLKIPVAGCVCTQGLLKKAELFRLKRGNDVIYEGKLSSMRHLKNEVDSVKKDVECGLKFENGDLRFQAGDVIVCYKKRWVPQTTDWDPGF